MSNSITSSIAEQLQRLKTKISTLNKKGDLHGLFSRHILSESPDINLDWVVTCNDKAWIEKVLDRSNLYHVASLGYSISISENGSSEANDIFLKSLEVIQKRNHFNGGHITFPFQPVTFLGLVLGAKHITDIKKRGKYINWLSSILRERRKRGEISNFHKIFYRYIQVQLENKSVTISDIRDFSSLQELSFVEWGYQHGHFQIPNSKDGCDRIGHKILKSLIETDTSQIAPEHTALIWAAADKSISGGIDRIIESPSHLSTMLKQFPAAMKRWRYDNQSVKEPIKWPIKNEKEVQDIVWLMLRACFEDLIDEESLPKFGHSSYKPDFAIPSLKTLLEVKYVRRKGEFKKIEKEIMVDSVGYLTNTKDYNKIMVFIYDHSSSVQEHEETRRDLIKIDSVEDVIIVSKPSQLPF